MLNKKPLLLIEPFTALPQTSGGRTRIFYTIQELDHQFELSVWSFSINKKEEILQSNWLQKMGIAFQYFSIKPKRFFSFFMTGQPYWFSDWQNEKLTSVLSEKSSNFPIIQIEFSQLLYLIKYLPKKSNRIFVAHDIASLSFWRRLQGENNLVKKILHFFRFLEVYLYEHKYLPMFDLVVAVSDHDETFLKTHFGLKRTKMIPNAIDGIHFLPPRRKDDFLNLGYIGSIGHTPNLEAIKFLFNRILPELEKQKIKYRFYLAGDNSLELINFLIDKSSIRNKLAILNLGSINELKDFYQAIDLLVAPIFAGSGTRIKILESLSYGRPILTTAVGAEGINIKSAFLQIIPKEVEKNILEWVSNIITLLNSDEKLIFEKKMLEIELSQLTWKNTIKIV